MDHPSHGYREVVRALVVADVVDSTALAERLGSVAIAALWASHDRAARAAIAAWRGREIDKTDGFLVLFEDPADAAGFAMAYHHELSSVVDGDGRPLRARVGVHVGPVVLRPNAADEVARGAKPLEADGVSKSVAARVCSIAPPGGTLLTHDARARLDAGPGGAGLTSLGHWRLKGVAEPVELFGLPGADGGAASPADGPKAWRVVREGQDWRPARDVPCGVPREPGPLVGRDADLKALAGLIDDGATLVTLTGAAGCGKTRLACRFARTWLGDFPAGAWFCDASNARTPESLGRAAVAALDVEPGSDPVRTVAGVLRTAGRLLLVLDNLEQVVDHAPATVGRWLVGEGVIVATSREPLGLPEERVLPLEPLPSGPAMALFEARARAQVPSWTGDRATLEAVVRSLDGLPLAIELAAARVRVLSLDAIHARLADRFALLGPVKGIRSRYATLRAAIDWSWDLLEPPERAALAAASVFEGSFDADAAEAVLGGTAAVDRLQALVERSLVRSVPGERSPRLSLLRSIRDYAAEKLTDAARREVEGRHGRYFGAFGSEEARARRVRGHGSVTHLRALRAAHDDVVAACRRAIAEGDAALAVSALDAAAAVGDPLQIVDLAASVRAVPGLDEPARAMVAAVLGRAFYESGRGAEAEPVLLEVLEVARRIGDPSLEVDALGRLGLVRHQRSRSGAVLLDEAIDIARREGLAGLGSLLNTRGTVIDDDVRAASAFYADAVAVAREVGDLDVEGRALSNLGVSMWETGDLDGARRHLEAGLAIHRERGNHRSAAQALANLGLVLRDEGRFHEAREILERAISTHRRVGNLRSLGLALGNLGAIEVQLGNRPVGRAHLEAALAISRELGNRRTEARLLAQLAELDTQAGRSEWSRRLGEAEALLRELGDADPLAILLCVRADLADRAGDDPWPSFAEARAIAARLTHGPSPELVRRLEDLERRLRRSP